MLNNSEKKNKYENNLTKNIKLECIRYLLLEKTRKVYKIKFNFHKK